MSAGMIIADLWQGYYLKPQNLCCLYRTRRTRERDAASLLCEKMHFTESDAVPATCVSRLVFRGQPAPADRMRSPAVMQLRAEAQETLICEAETALARQTVHTYRRWFSRWRGRGVGVNDLLNMTWAWSQRATV